MFRFIILLTVFFVSPALFAQTTNLAPGAPGEDAHWPSAAKNGFGTSNTLASKVWFTLNSGVMTEVFYPTLDTPNTQSLEFILCKQQRCWRESEHFTHTIRISNPRSLSFQQTNSSRHNKVSIRKSYTTDPERPSVLIDVRVAASDFSQYRLYLVFDPSLKNSGLHDTAWSEPNALLTSDADISAAVVLSTGLTKTNNGFLGTSDGVSQLMRSGALINSYPRAADGNVVQVGMLTGAANFTVALAFGRTSKEALDNANASLKKGFAQAQREYERGWQNYVAKLRPVTRRYVAQYQMAAMVLKGLEDKQYRGAMIASPSNPWGAGPNANEPTTTGYHAVWARDLYHVATAFHAMGDSEAANRALDYLFRVQQTPDGSFPQNSRVNGTAIGRALQLDQVGLALVLANQLERTDREFWRQHIKPAAEFILRKGPTTEQERWEEESGYSPSTLAAAIAGLVCAARIARLNGDEQSAAIYELKADEWESKINQWAATTTGSQAKGRYFLRIDQNGDPNDGGRLEINSNGGTYDEREIIDASFLELVRLGIRSPHDPLVKRTLGAIDRVIKTETPNGSAWYRYNHDAYGERDDGGGYDGRSGKGRLWPLLTGERGQYELALSRRASSRQRLDSMMRFANDGLMLPEQVWDGPNSPRTHLKFGEGTGSATPLAWSMAQFIRLVLNVQAGKNLETPVVVTSRYVSQKQLSR